ncbi:LiaI-LiaF-like domain-containing protein [Heyndrickxia ginsengihumi]|uniref:LiaI-LiaF-like transmembrane region domain-containing protein n=1 Tax=Heyndrickxia ginsengihumi TaxID=363870 RepID=A0A0A6VF80_9BACI|nr:DUF5668 domain-containing protein [Heyndrickxia ginsengihumi]KHD86900.1 hypothetical protein NG54_00550 [Heyndrickxia ginsengihumi]MBE6183835.1 hypothetical protein [Bacillus sp. (in: firmicutes)]MCM3021913.1 DUF5668 domain-containing protein [Heyndrickxia ginsengihumi]NEY20401.1 hypothetical protein [Heyndrickxia ginsengihumi]
MKNQKIFPAVILIGFGLYFYLQRYHLEGMAQYFTWPTLLIIVGLAFLGQGYWGNDYEAILPGVILVGFGLHFHIVHKIAIWPDNIGIFILIISLGFLLRYQKTGDGLLYGLLFLLLSVVLLFSDKTLSWFGLVENNVSSLWNFWPAILVIIGFYLLIIKRKGKGKR